MKRWLTLLLLVLVTGCASNPWSATFEGDATENWALSEGPDSNNGELVHGKVRLALSEQEANSVLATVDDIVLHFEKPAEGETAHINAQKVTRTLNGEDIEFSFEGDLRIYSDGAAQLELLGTPSSKELKGNCSYDFTGSRIKLAESS